LQEDERKKIRISDSKEEKQGGESNAFQIAGISLYRGESMDNEHVSSLLGDACVGTVVSLLL
jgi:hypothetical protein